MSEQYFVAEYKMHRSRPEAVRINDTCYITAEQGNHRMTFFMSVEQFGQLGEQIRKLTEAAVRSEDTE